MAGPTTQQLSDRLDKHAEQERDLESTVSALVERVDHVRENLKRLEDVVGKLADSLSTLTTQQAMFEARITTLEKSVEDQRKAAEERDRKQWMLWVAFIAAILALVGNLAVALIRK